MVGNGDPSYGVFGPLADDMKSSNEIDTEAEAWGENFD